MIFEGYTVTTDATAEPVTATELREWLRLDDTSQDTMLDGMITAARIAVELHTHRSVVQKTLKQSLADFPAGGCIELLYPPLATVTTLNYWDTDGTEQTIDSSNYLTITNRVVGAVQPVDSYSWPSAYDRSDAVNVTYVTKDDTPAQAAVLIKMIAADMYEHAETQSELRLSENRQWKFLLESLTIKDYY